MRVALNGWFWNAPTTGSGQYLRRLVKALTALPPDQRPDLVVFTPYAISEVEQARVRRWGARIESHPAAGHSLGKVWWEQVTVPRLARRCGADLLHVPYWAPPCTASPRGRAGKGRPPTVVTVHDLIPMLLPAYRGHALVRLYTALVRAATPAAQLILTDSKASRHDILAHLKLSPERVWAVPLAVGEGYTPEPVDSDGAVRERLGLPDEYVLYLGGFDQRKNLQTLFAAFEIAWRAREESRLVVAGRLPTSDTAFAPDPRRLAREQGLPDAAGSGPVTFTGYVDEADKPALLRGARAFVFPSIYEGFGYPCLEAIACGTPVVGSQASSLPEVVGPAGVLVPPLDYEGMAGALLQIMIDDAFYAELRAHAVAQAQTFSWSRTARETLAAYRAAYRGNPVGTNK